MRDDPLVMSRRTKCTPVERAAEYLERIAWLTGAKQDDDGTYHLTAGGTHFLVDAKNLDEALDILGALYEQGYAHSVEAWQRDELVGGLYGVALRGVFFGESMFSRSSDASKVALVHLVARLVKGGFRLLDTQFVTDHLRRFGAVEIPRADYHRRLEQALAVEAYFAAGLADMPLIARPGLASGLAASVISLPA